LLLLPVLFAAGWWWVTWPERTAKRFIELLAAGDVPRAQAMIDGPQPSDGFWRVVVSREFAFNTLTFQLAKRRDYLSAQRTFSFNWQRKGLTGWLGQFVAHRNRIMLDPSAGNLRRFLSGEVRYGNGGAVLGKLLPLFPDSQKYEFEAFGEGSIQSCTPESAHSEIRALVYLFDDEFADAAAGRKK
jgi:hypothetical protein